MNVLQLLNKTRELLSSPSKWVKGALYRSGGYCLMGALQYTATGRVYEGNTNPDDWVYDQAMTRCRLAIWESYNEREWDTDIEINRLPDIPTWNDNDGRDHDQLMETLDRAIKLEIKVSGSVVEERSSSAPRNSR